MKNYMKAVVHALAVLLYRRDEAMEIVAEEPLHLMKVSDRAELRRQVDAIAARLRVKPYPTVEAIVNSNEIAAREYGVGVENPLTLWDLHHLKELDDEGFVDDLVSRISKGVGCRCFTAAALRSRKKTFSARNTPPSANSPPLW